MISKEQIKNFLTVHKEKIDFGFFLAKGLKEFQTNKSIFSLIESAFTFAQNNLTNDHQFSHNYLTKSNGWYLLTDECENFPVELFKSCLEQFESYKIKVNDKLNDLTVYKLSCGDIVYYEYQSGSYIYYKKGQCNAQSIVDLFIEIKFQQLQNNFVSLQIDDQYGRPTKFEFSSNNILIIDSKKSECFVERLKTFKEKNICRSILFYGMPGTGKSNLIKSIVNKLDYKALQISLKNNNSFEYLKILFILKMFKFDALVIDDFDSACMPQELLKFLEDIRPHLKLVFASANLLKNIHPALERPGRFDEKVLIDSLDEDSVKDILKDLSNEYFDKVKSWPVAYLNEFVLRAENYPKEELNDSFIELDQRVKDQIAKLKV